MQAAAAAPVAAPKRSAVEQPAFAPQEPTSDLPLINDQALSGADAKLMETRRRTVADFLYSAGQYASARMSTQPMAQATTANMTTPAQSNGTAMATASMPASSGAGHAPASMPSGSFAAQTKTVNPSAPVAQSVASTMVSSGTVQRTAMPTSPGEEADSFVPYTMEQEPMPRRMGQILRVDVPRTRQTQAATANPAMENAVEYETEYEASARVAATSASMSNRVASAPVMQPVMQPGRQPVMQPGMQPGMQPADSPAMSVSMKDRQVDAAARYVLEQRRMDKAHQIGEMEEKLRQQTHKVFNPVWEVDRLQWPAVVDKLMQQRADSMSQVAAHLKAACQDGLSVLGVTSADKGEGRTTVACCLARLASTHGLNVALVDLDLDHPTLCIQTNMEIENDWRDCLSEDIGLEEVAVHSIEDQLTIVPLKARGGRPGLLASDSRITEMLQDLAECFELVIVDCARMNSAGNVISGLAHTNIFDAAIVVVDRRDSAQERVQDAVFAIQKSGIESIGIVDNFAM